MIYKKARIIKNGDVLRDLLCSYTDERAKKSSDGPSSPSSEVLSVSDFCSLDVQRSGSGVIPCGFLPIEVPQLVSPNLADQEKLRALTRWWLANRNQNKKKAYHLVFSISRSLSIAANQGKGKGDSILLPSVINSLLTYQFRFYPLSSLGYVVGLHHDTDNLHAHVVLYPETHAGTPLNLCRFSSQLIHGRKLWIPFQSAISEGYSTSIQSYSQSIGHGGKPPYGVLDRVIANFRGVLNGVRERQVKEPSKSLPQLVDEHLEAMEKISGSDGPAVLSVQVEAPDKSTYKNLVAKYRANLESIIEASSARLKKIGALRKKLKDTLSTWFHNPDRYRTVSYPPSNQPTSPSGTLSFLGQSQATGDSKHQEETLQLLNRKLQSVSDGVSSLEAGLKEVELSDFTQPNKTAHLSSYPALSNSIALIAPLRSYRSLAVPFPPSERKEACLFCSSERARAQFSARIRKATKAIAFEKRTISYEDLVVQNQAYRRRKNPEKGAYAPSSVIDEVYSIPTLQNSNFLVREAAKPRLRSIWELKAEHEEISRAVTAIMGRSLSTLPSIS